MAKASKTIIKCEAMRLKGPVAFIGEMELTETELRFKPTGMVNRIIGAATLVLPIRKIERVAIVGLNETALVWVDQSPHRFLGAGAQKVLEALETLLLDQAESATPSSSTSQLGAVEVLSQEQAKRLIFDWAEQIGYNAEETVIFSTPVIRRAKNATSRGWVLITDKDRVLYLPSAGQDSAELPIEMSLKAIRPAGRISSPVLRMTDGETNYVFAPVGGSTITERFWDLCATKTRVDDSADREKQARTKIMGRPKSLWIRQDGDLVFSTKVCMLISVRDGIGLVVIDRPDPPFPEKMPIRVEVCLNDGIYWFDTVVVSTRRAFQPIRIGRKKGRHIVVLRNPKRIRGQNRRDNYRIKLRGREAWILKDLAKAQSDGLLNDDEITVCEIDNISASGCLIQSTSKMEAGTTIDVILSFLSRKTPIKARVVRSIASTREENSWLVALTFPSINDQYADLVHRFIADEQLKHIRRAQEDANPTKKPAPPKPKSDK